MPDLPLQFLKHPDIVNLHLLRENGRIVRGTGKITAYRDIEKEEKGLVVRPGLTVQPVRGDRVVDDVIDQVPEGIAFPDEAEDGVAIVEIAFRQGESGGDIIVGPGQVTEKAGAVQFGRFLTDDLQ